MDPQDRRFIRAFILLGRQAALLNYIARRRVPRVLSAFERSVGAGNQGVSDVLRVYDLAFSLVDNICRYQKIAEALPRFSRKSAEFRKFSESISGLKELRNLLQHVDGDMNTEFKSPILGGVTWSKSVFNYIACFHDVGEKRSLPGLPFHAGSRSFSKQFCYVHDGKYYDFGRAIEGCRAYQRYVEASTRVEVDGKSYCIEEHFAAARFAFVWRDSV